MSLVWQDILSSLELSSADQELGQRFLKQPDGRLFLPVAEVLAQHGLAEESLFLLMEGLEKHPRYTAARVKLADSLFARSLFTESWQALRDPAMQASGNKSALLLLFQLSLLFGDESACLQYKQQLQILGGLPVQVARLAEQLSLLSFAAVADELKIYLDSSGYDLSLLKSQATDLSLQGQAHSQKVQLHIAGFAATALDQVFARSHSASKNNADPAGLRVIDLVKVYRRQRQYEKAINILKKLVYMNPNNDSLQRELKELKELRAQQKLEEQQADPVLAENLAKLDDVEARLNLLGRLMKGLGT